MRFLTKCALAAALSSALCASAAMADTLKLKMGFVDPASSSYAMGGQKFADELKKLTDGQIEVQVLASGTLGGEREMYEGAQMGTMDIITCVNTVMSQFIPEMSILDELFLFDNVDQAHAVADGKFGELVAEKAAAQGVHIIGWLESGFRDTFSKNPIKTLEDFKKYDVCLATVQTFHCLILQVRRVLKSTRLLPAGQPMFMNIKLTHLKLIMLIQISMTV